MDITSKRRLFFTFYICFQFAAGFQNFTELMRKYFLLCGGEYFCNDPKQFHGWDISMKYKYRHLGVCPECSCDKDCVLRGDCCPDLFLSFPELVCVNRTIINGKYDKNRTEQNSALMVTSCPKNSTRDQREKCTSLTDTKSRLSNFPVTESGNDFPLTFYNKYCAECNNVTNYTSWTLDIDCNLFADFNFLSTLDDIIETAVSRKCVFQAFHEIQGREIKEENCFDINENSILKTKCNETGEWRNFDPDVKQACESSLKTKFKVFKNVFCYMCNPSGRNFMEEIYETCNETGQWHVFDRDLNRACDELPQSDGTFPYKNIFCYLCNRGIALTKPFVDVFSVPQEFSLRDTNYPYLYKLDIFAFDLEYFKYKLLQRIPEEQNLHFEKFEISSFRNKFGKRINLTNLLLQGLALDGKMDVCKSRNVLLPFDTPKSCSCDPSCFFTFGIDCCTDLALEVPLTRLYRQLRYNSIGTDVKRYYNLIDGCLQEQRYSIFEKECSFNTSDDIFTNIPVTGKRKKISFANLYCVFCNMNMDEYVLKLNGITMSTNSEDQPTEMTIEDYLSSVFKEYEQNSDGYAIWKMEIACPQYLDYTHILSMGYMIRLARLLKCVTEYKTEARMYNDFSSGFKSDCKTRKNWTYANYDISWACNNVSTLGTWRSDIKEPFPTNLSISNKNHYREYNKIYTNLYCALCKPKHIDTAGFVNSCIESQNDSRCIQSTRIYYYYPFKNFYCVRCNDINDKPDGEYGPPGVFPPDWSDNTPKAGINWFPIIRNLFSINLKDENDGLIREDLKNQCERDQVYDSQLGKCRNITCYSGKYLNGEVCLPLLQITQNLRFSLKVRLGVYYKDSHSKIAFWPKPFERIKSDLEFHLAIKGILKYDIVATTEKFENPEKEIDFVCWIVKFEIFIYSSAPRLHVEESLLEFKTKLLDGCNMEDPNEQLMFRRLSRDFTNPHENALSTPYHIRIKYFQARISNILLCRQIELTEEEYNASDGNSEVLLLRSGIHLPYDEFDRVPDGSVRVCLEDLQKRQYFMDGYHDGPLANLQLKYLWIMSLICSVISLISLLLSLIIYLSFPVLHTTPGKLLIIMMVSLFITLCFLQLSYFVANSNAGCLAVAVILHFSWLSVFTSMLATNFHMFRTFSSTELHRHSSGRFFDKTISKYGIFIVGLPIVFIIVNVSLSWFINSDDNFGYGGGNCFINDRYLLISTFIFPIGLICILNIIFFFITIHAIHKTPNPESTHQKRSEMTIYLRLTSITGISWTLQIIDSFLPVSTFTFVSSSINSLQGCFVFLAFIANKRTIKLLRDKISKQKESITTSDRLTEVNSKDIKQSSCV